MKVLSSKWEKFLSHNGIDSDSTIWGLNPAIDLSDLGDEPGFSIVSRLHLEDQNGQSVPMILTRQWLPKSEKSGKNGKRGLPIEEETGNYQRLKKKGVRTLPRLAASGSIKTRGGTGAFALYKELDEFISLDHLLSTWGKSPLLTRQRKRILLKALGKSIRQLHDAKFTHNELSPNHIFIRFIETTDGSGPKVDTRIIDLAHGEVSFFFRDKGKKDLLKLRGYASALNSTELLRFFLAYSGSKRLTSKIKSSIRRTFSI